MKRHSFSRMLALAALACAGGLASAMTVSPSVDANALANDVAGPGVTIFNPSLATASPQAAGTFAGAADSIGFDKGVLLTTGSVACAPGPNNSGECGAASGMTTWLKFNFTTSTGNMFLKYVFASEEYPDWINSLYNDRVEILLNGNNIAMLPGGGGPVSIVNVNGFEHAAYFRNNTGTTLDTQYDGLTTILTASASGLVGANTLEINIADLGDQSHDSAVFLPTNGLTALAPVPEPATYGMLLSGLGVIGLLAGRKRARADKAARQA